MNFKTIDAYYQESECGNYRIAKSKDHTVRDGVVFTLSSKGKMLAQERCNNVASERAQAVKDLQKLAGEL